ncbi:MAG TPA: sigma 54-interacting transcriptional regulator [Candidatus Eremiobacteraceae bacterium]|nr:sigma 54-interacting transcriptional regulator [Candidatus Eremiobacteraceae bacterium]
MRAKLVAINGPLRKSEFPILEQVILGRDTGNTVRIEDPWVSARHCTITENHGRYILVDLESHAGTFVNGIPVKERDLKSGDEIAIGNSLFLFQEERAAISPASSVQMDDGDVPNAEAAELQPEGLIQMAPGALAALPAVERYKRNLQALARISCEIGSLRDEESLPWQLLGMIFDVIPAERGAILLLEENSPDMRAQVAWDRTSGPDHPVRVSQALVNRIAQEKTPLWDHGSKGAQAFLCVPMLSKNQTIGIIYMESSRAVASFAKEDLELLSAIAGLGVIGIENARKFEQLENENRWLRAEVSLTHDMVGRSIRMREVYQFVERVAASDSTVLIFGESGTGKELAARAIHKNSSRKDQPFVGLNCAALTETLLESELFGHEKGAFTSAVGQKKGYLEVAEGGTIFLDEIGELSQILQAKLLRVLQEREFVRVGGTRPIKIDVRFLAATNRDLQKAVREERFRADLFHRLNVISLTLPALRERPEDIPELAEYFAARYAKKCNRRVCGISEEALACLRRYDWPGNIRELENAMERAVVIGSSDKIMPEDLPEILQDSGEDLGGRVPAKYHDAILNLKKQMILGALEQTAGNITDAAKVLGVHANYLHRLMRNLELRPKIKKQSGASN